MSKKYSDDLMSAAPSEGRLRLELRKLTNSENWVSATRESSASSSRASTPVANKSKLGQQLKSSTKKRNNTSKDASHQLHQKHTEKPKKFRMVLEKDDDYEVDYLSPEEADSSASSVKDEISDASFSDGEDYYLDHEHETSVEGRSSPFWLKEELQSDDEEIPALVLPNSSDDLLMDNNLILPSLAVYEVLRHFRNSLRLSPFLFEDFCAALTRDETTVLLNECHIALLKVILKEEDNAGVVFVPVDQKDAYNTAFFFLDHMTWPQVLRAFVESSPEFQNFLPIVQEQDYPCVEVSKKIQMLQFLTNLFLASTKIRDELMTDGAIRYDDHCRACHQLGDLLCCETCPAVYHLACCNPPLKEVPDDEWQCEICVAHRLNGVSNCEREFEMAGHYLRHDPIGLDRHGRKYWFLVRRLFVESENEVWYYTTYDEFKYVLSKLDHEKYEMVLCEALKDVLDEFPRQSQITEEVTNEAKWKNCTRTQIEIMKDNAKNEMEKEKREVEEKIKSVEKNSGGEDIAKESNKEELMETDAKDADGVKESMPNESVSNAKEEVAAPSEKYDPSTHADDKEDSSSTTQSISVELLEKNEITSKESMPASNGPLESNIMTAAAVATTSENQPATKTATSASTSAETKAVLLPLDIKVPLTRCDALVNSSFVNKQSTQSGAIFRVGQKIQLKAGTTAAPMTTLKNLFVLSKDGVRTPLVIGPDGKLSAGPTQKLVMFNPPSTNANKEAALPQSRLSRELKRLQFAAAGPKMQKLVNMSGIPLQAPPPTVATDTALGPLSVSSSQATVEENAPEEQRGLSPPRKPFRLGEDGGYTQYKNYFVENTLALNKYQHKEEKDRERHVGYKFSLNGPVEFDWPGALLGTRDEIIHTLRSALFCLEQQMPLCFMHSKWEQYRKMWGRMLVRNDSVKAFSVVLGILEMAIRDITKRNTWREGLGQVRMRRLTMLEKELYEKRKKRRTKTEEELSLRNAVWCKYPLPVRSSMVWKMKGEEYRVTGYGGWMWISSTFKCSNIRAMPKLHTLFKSPVTNTATPVDKESGKGLEEAMDVDALQEEIREIIENSDVINVSKNLLVRSVVYNKRWPTSKLDKLLRWRVLQEKERIKTISESKSDSGKQEATEEMKPEKMADDKPSQSDDGKADNEQNSAKLNEEITDKDIEKIIDKEVTAEVSCEQTDNGISNKLVQEEVSAKQTEISVMQDDEQISDKKNNEEVSITNTERMSAEPEISDGEEIFEKPTNEVISHKTDDEKLNKDLPDIHSAKEMCIKSELSDNEKTSDNRITETTSQTADEVVLNKDVDIEKCDHPEVTDGTDISETFAVKTILPKPMEDDASVQQLDEDLLDKPEISDDESEVIVAGQLTDVLAKPSKSHLKEGDVEECVSALLTAVEKKISSWKDTSAAEHFVQPMSEPETEIPRSRLKDNVVSFSADVVQDNASQSCQVTAAESSVPSKAAVIESEMPSSQNLISPDIVTPTTDLPNAVAPLPQSVGSENFIPTSTVALNDAAASNTMATDDVSTVSQGITSVSVNQPSQIVTSAVAIIPPHNVASDNAFHKSPKAADDATDVSIDVVETKIVSRGETVIKTSATVITTTSITTKVNPANTATMCETSAVSTLTTSITQTTTSFSTKTNFISQSSEINSHVPTAAKSRSDISVHTVTNAHTHSSSSSRKSTTIQVDPALSRGLARAGALRISRRFRAYKKGHASSGSEKRPSTCRPWKLTRSPADASKKTNEIKMPIPWKFALRKESRKSIFRLPRKRVKYIATRGGLAWYPLGFRHVQKSPTSLELFWPYRCVRPTIGLTWRYKLQTTTTLAGIAHLLRVLWHSIRWDDIVTKPATDDVIHTVHSDDDIISMELLKRRNVGDSGLRSEYFVRRITVPSTDHDEEIPRSEAYTPSSRSGLRTRGRQMNLRERSKKEMSTVEPKVETLWMPEDKIELWQIRQFDSLIRSQQKAAAKLVAEEKAKKEAEAKLAAKKAAMREALNNHSKPEPAQKPQIALSPAFLQQAVALHRTQTSLASSNLATSKVVTANTSTQVPQSASLVKIAASVASPAVPGFQKVMIRPHVTSQHFVALKPTFATPTTTGRTTFLHTTTSPTLLQPATIATPLVIQGNKVIQRKILIRPVTGQPTTPRHPTIKLSGIVPPTKFIAPLQAATALQAETKATPSPAKPLATIQSSAPSGGKASMQLKLTASQLNDLVHAEGSSVVKIPVSFADGRPGMGQLQLVPPGTPATPGPGQQLMQCRVGNETKRFLLTALADSTAAVNNAAETSDNEVTLKTPSLRHRLEQLQTRPQEFLKQTGSTSVHRLMTDKDPLWGGRSNNTEKETNVIEKMAKKETAERPRKKQAAVSESREETKRRNVVQQVMKSILDRIERKEEMEARKRRKEEKEEQQRRKRESMDVAKSQQKLHSRLLHALIRHEEQLRHDIRKRKTITEKYLTRIVENELYEDRVKMKRRRTTQSEGVVKPARKSSSSYITTSNARNILNESHKQDLGKRKRKRSEMEEEIVIPKKKLIKSSSKLYCICKMPYDDTRFYIGCDLCMNWFHGSCVGISERRAKHMDTWVCQDCDKVQSDPQQELYCLCKTPYDDSQFYIGCDVCQDWYHGSCVGISEAEAGSIERYTCPRCKKQARDASKERTLTERELATLTKIVRHLQNHKMAWPFLEPVRESDVPGYYKVVKRPMDLQTVMKRLRARHYRKLSDLVSDVSLIFDNCRQFNGADSNLVRCAEIVESVFVGKIRDMKGR